jgi:hypothetical protein
MMARVFALDRIVRENVGQAMASDIQVMLIHMDEDEMIHGIECDARRFYGSQSLSQRGQVTVHHS